MNIAWGAYNRAKQGQSISGDAWLVAPLNGSGILAAVVDGLGGGEEAARAARLAETIFRERAERPLQELIRISHEALHTTRGAVVGLLRLDPIQSNASYIASAISASMSTAGNRSSRSRRTAFSDIACRPCSN